MRAPLLAALALALCACGGRPAYYLLPPVAPAARQAAPAGSVVVADLSLPAYAGALEIAALTGPGTLELAPRALWADQPQRALSRHLAAALEARLGARVATEPWPGFDAPARRVEVSVDRMVGAPGGGLDFAGQYAIVEPSSGRLVALDRFALSVPPQGEGYPGLLAAHARAVEALADRIAARLARGGPTS